ncbi:MAG: methylglutaconyl-CoA hydratase [Paraburkholderia sp.]|nr:methylglutaconyl-CoA hydratase [Paraburkholderia sp.]
MQYAMLKVEYSQRIATVTLNRPDVRNAFNETMIAELTDAFDQLEMRDDVLAVVLAANGAAFCAGADLNWMKKMASFSDEENRADARRLANMLAVIYRSSKPVISCVSGDAYAGGVGLIAASDVVVAVQSARFCLSEARLGLIAATIAPYVVRAIGERASGRYFLTAEQFDCETAARLGLVHEVVAADALEATVQRIAAALCANGPQAVRESKRLVQDVAGCQIDEALIDDTAARIARIRAGAEAREGVAAFLEKRAPSWRD